MQKAAEEIYKELSFFKKTDGDGAIAQEEGI